MSHHPCSRILVVDDDPDLLDTICELLSLEGIEVTGAGSGRDALELLARDPLPSAILLDLGMPGMTGEQFLERLRADARLRGIPVAVMSGYAAQRYAYLPDADVVIQKPFSLDRVNDALSTLCRDGRRKTPAVVGA